MKIPVLDKECQIVIPTHQRTALKDQKTWLSLPESLRFSTLLLTSTKEDMKALRRSLQYDHVYCVDDPSIDGIAKKRQWIIENIKSEFIFQMDDDLTFQHRCPRSMRFLNDAGTWKMHEEFSAEKFIRIKELTEKDKIRAWNRFMDRSIGKGYVHGGLGPRMGNNNAKEEFRKNTRLMQCLYHHRKTLLKKSIRFDRVRFREDFHVTLSLLKLGYTNILNQQFIVNADPFGKKGGCTDERTVEASNKQAELLAKLHTPFVKTVEREYSNTVNRIEVVCFWAKAFASSGKNRRLKI